MSPSPPLHLFHPPSGHFPSHTWGGTLWSYPEGLPASPSLNTGSHHASPLHPPEPSQSEKQTFKGRKKAAGPPAPPLPRVCVCLCVCTRVRVCVRVRACACARGRSWRGSRQPRRGAGRSPPRSPLPTSRPARACFPARAWGSEPPTAQLEQPARRMPGGGPQGAPAGGRGGRRAGRGAVSGAAGKQ